MQLCTSNDSLESQRTISNFKSQRTLSDLNHCRPCGNKHFTMQREEITHRSTIITGYTSPCTLSIKYEFFKRKVEKRFFMIAWMGAIKRWLINLQWNWEDKARFCTIRNNNKNYDHNDIIENMYFLCTTQNENASRVYARFYANRLHSFWLNGIM